jgi:hypothetical protein
MNIAELAKRFYEHEVAEAAPTGQGLEYGARAWAFVMRQLTFAECTELAAKGPEFIFSDNSNDPLWEKVQDLLNFWEEWSYGDLTELAAQACDDKASLADSVVWEWILNHMAFSREDYEFCGALLETKNEELCYVFFQGSEYGSLTLDPHHEDFVKIKPGYDPEPLYNRLDAAYTLWETTVTSMGDEWRNQP